MIAHDAQFRCQGLVTAIAVMSAESSFDPALQDENIRITGYDSAGTPTNGVYCSTDRGIWQWNERVWPAYADDAHKLAHALNAPQATADAFIQSKGTTFSYWLAYDFSNSNFVKAVTSATAAAKSYNVADHCGPPCLADGTCPPVPDPRKSKRPTPVGSLDPNDKEGPSGVGSARFLTGVQPITYSIYFQNKPNATAPAQTVTITDALNTNLDLSTVTLGPITFPIQVITPPSIPISIAPFTTTVDLRPTTNLLVKINASLATTTGTLTWMFQSLDPATNQPPTDPLAGFLPSGAEGSVFFTVMPKSTVATGTAIQNTAIVVFDTNPPISTPTWSNTIDNTPPTSHVAALAATQTNPNFAVLWSGSDVGSGIQDYTVYVSDTGGHFTAWLTNTTATSAVYSGQPNHAYGFYSIARDLVGNVEGTKSAVETTTKVVVTALTIFNYQLVSRQAAAGAQSYLTYRGDLINPGASLGAVAATLTSLDPFSVRVVPGQGTLNFAPVPANGQVTSSNTFAILTDTSIPLDFSKLQWTFQTTAAPPVANPGPNQTVKVGSTVMLDGSGSMNPSGVGALTYNWVFTSRPSGTATRLVYTTTASTMFVADVPGTYVIQFTVSNGAASSSTNVTITATASGVGQLKGNDSTLNRAAANTATPRP